MKLLLVAAAFSCVSLLVQGQWTQVPGGLKHVTASVNYILWCELNLVYYRLDRHHTQPITIWFHLGSSHCIASPLIYNSLLF